MLHLGVFLFFSLLALLFFPQLITHFSVAIPGGLEDTRIFLWNAWWVRHAIQVLHTNPYFTRLLFYPYGVSLISHDFPIWTNLVTYTAQTFGLNLIAANNCWFLVSWVLSGFCTYLLVWEVIHQRAPAIVAGIYVMTNSYTLARAMQNWGQFNLYGIALFLWIWLHARRTGRTRDYILAGVALAWTAACHYYFLIYCGVVWAAAASLRLLPRLPRWEWRWNPSAPAAKYFLGLAILAGALASWIHFTHPTDVVWGRFHIGLESPANALLVMWLALYAWGAYHWQLDPPQLNENYADQNHLMRQDGALFITAIVCLSPLIIAMFREVLQGNIIHQGILWKTHPLGANLLALVTPNPLQMLWGPGISRWMIGLGLNTQEQAASIGWVCLGVVIWSQVWRDRQGRKWLVLAAAATVLSLGIYLHVLGRNLWMPLPFYVWRLLPFIGNVRIPERWMALGAIAWGVVLALALVHLARKKGYPLHTLCGVAGVLILAENWPGIPLGSPPVDYLIYETLRQQPTGAVLPLPLYIGDSSVGAGSAEGTWVWELLASQIYHQHPMLGGFVGRIPRSIIRDYQTDPFIHELLHQEEGSTEPPPPLADACQSLKKMEVDYVLVVPAAITPAALAYARQSLPLEPIQKTPEMELYRTSCPR